MKKYMSKTIKLCRRGCCPTIEKIEEDKYLVKDDFDGEVILKRDEIEIMYASLEELDIE